MSIPAVVQHVEADKKQDTDNVLGEYVRAQPTLTSVKLIPVITKIVSIEDCIGKQLITRWSTSIHISGFTSWSQYSSCSETCGSGTKTKTRQCVDGSCLVATASDLIDTQSCYDQDCKYFLSQVTKTYFLSLLFLKI